MDVIKKPFGEMDGTAVESYTLKNDSGMEMTFITYGAAITKILTPDKDGVLERSEEHTSELQSQD